MTVLSKPRSLSLISLWCWLNVLAMAPTLHDPVIVLFGFAESGPSASTLKLLIFANSLAISLAVSMKLHPGRIILIAWLPFVFLSNLFINLIPSCPAPVKVAAYQQVLFGGLIPYLYVTVVRSSSFLVMHLVDAASTALIVYYLIKYRSLFRKRSVRRPARDGAH